MIFTHEAQPGGVHTFTFPSTTRRGLKHHLTLEPNAARPEERLICTCEAGLFNRLCKHKRFVLTGRMA